MSAGNSDQTVYVYVSLSSLNLGNEKSARSFSARSFFAPSGVVDVRAGSGHGCPHPDTYLSKVSRACPNFLTRDVRTNVPGTSVGCPAQKLSFWALFSFLTTRTQGETISTTASFAF